MIKQALKKTGLLLLLILLITTPVTAQEQASEGAQEDLSETIKERLKKASNDSVLSVTDTAPTALVGTLESVANGTLTIKTKTGVSLASVNDDTAYVRLPKSETIAFEDVAIGDYVIAMGFVNGSEVLEAERVVVSSTPPTPSTKQSLVGTVIAINQKTDTLTITSPTGSETDVTFDDSQLFSRENAIEEVELDFDDLEEGKYVLAIYQPEAEKDEDEPPTNTLLYLLVAHQPQSEEADTTATGSSSLEEE